MNANITKQEIIELILCADYYEFGHEVLYSFLLSKISDLSEDDVKRILLESYDPQSEEEIGDCEVKLNIVMNLIEMFNELETE